MATEYSPQQIMAATNPTNGLPEPPYPQQAVPMNADMHPDNSPGVGPVNSMQMPGMPPNNPPAPPSKKVSKKGENKRGK